MSKFKKAEREIREFHKELLAQYIAKIIEIKHRIYKIHSIDSFQHILITTNNSFNYSIAEQKEIYNLVDSLLIEEHNLLIANEAFNDSHIYLVDIGKEN